VPAAQLEADLPVDADRHEAQPLVQADAGLVGQRDRVATSQGSRGSASIRATTSSTPGGVSSNETADRRTTGA
jgi:hypothetical protein